MRNASAGALRQIAACVVLLSLVPFVSAEASPTQGQNSSEQGAVASSAQAQSSDSNNPGQKSNAGPSEAETFPNSPGAVRSQTAENNPPFVGQQASSGEQQTQEPVGTAAAESVEPTGVAASKPAGAAIAPAKQKRTRSLLIKVGALVGASVAIGTVVALSSASPSRPTGAR